jgi:hypothetical protein
MTQNRECAVVPRVTDEDGALRRKEVPHHATFSTVTWELKRTDEQLDASERLKKQRFNREHILTSTQGSYWG